MRTRTETRYESGETSLVVSKCSENGWHLDIFHKGDWFEFPWSGLHYPTREHAERVAESLLDLVDGDLEDYYQELQRIREERGDTWWNE